MQKRTKGFLMIVMLILGLIFGGSSGCTNQETKGMTPVEKAEYLEDKRILRREEFVDFIIACHYKGYVLVYQGYASSIGGYAHVGKDGIVHIPRHHKQYDYQCGTGYEVIQALEDAGWIGNSRLNRY
jgi:hypothetical protein